MVAEGLPQEWDNDKVERDTQRCVDLNPIRAGMAETPEDSDFTSIQARLRQFATTRQSEQTAPADPTTSQPADLLPFVGGEHANAPKGIALTLPDYLPGMIWAQRVAATPAIQ